MPAFFAAIPIDANLRFSLNALPRERNNQSIPQKPTNCRDFTGFSICSYPPEDVVIEGYGQYLQKRAFEIKSEENSRIEPFMCSMQEGLDIRETIRDWPSGKIYVKAERPLEPHSDLDQSNIKLTHRQMDVLQLLIDGESNKSIARNLGLAENTVKIHVASIFKSLGVANRTQAALEAQKLGLFD